MKTILISQGTLEMGRNRDNRRLIARLDAPKNNKTLSPVLCEYQSRCPNNIHKYSMKCIYGKDNCQVRRYFMRLKNETNN